jgi:hypothetical protein
MSAADQAPPAASEQTGVTAQASVSAAAVPAQSDAAAQS